MKSKIFITILAVLAIASSCKNGTKKSSNDSQTKNEVTDKKMNSTSAFDPTELSEEPVFRISTSEGDIVIKLYKETPLHRDNFVKLASQKFFDGILFHRVINGFMIQCGDPNTKDSSKAAQFGSGGPGYTIPAEFVATYHHKKGAVAAARLGDSANPEKESSGSQFYIVHDPENCKHLDGEYTIFGETLEGLDVVDRIATAETDERDRPKKDVKILSVTPVL